MKTHHFIRNLTLTGLLTIPTSASAVVHVVGWQTFENVTAGNNNSGIGDNTPDTNSTFDSSPVGSNSGGLYLTASIGANASAQGRRGLGQATNNNFLNGSTFGSSLTISDYTLADGSPGARIGPFGGAGTSSWKFGNNNVNQLSGDFSITNNSDYALRLEHIHFDARGAAAAASPTILNLNYLAGPGNLINVSTGTELSDGRNLYSNTWSSTGVENVSRSLAAAIGSATRLAPGDSASFRFLWSGQSGSGQAQIDNLAFSGTFLDQNNGFAVIDPVTIPEPGSAALLLLASLGLFVRAKR